LLLALDILDSYQLRQVSGNSRVFMSVIEGSSQMKIDGFDHGFSRVHADKSAHTAVPGPCGFGDILKEKLATAPGATASGIGLGLVAPTQIQSVAEAPANRLAERVERYLDLLDDYRRQLADPRVSLKGLDATVREMEAGKDALAPALGSLPEGDGIKNILNRTLVTSSLEIIKFRRGDYLTA
jgi:hypothetical protein